MTLSGTLSQARRHQPHRVFLHHLPARYALWQPPSLCVLSLCLLLLLLQTSLTLSPPLFAGLAAAADVVGVTLGGILGHALCTGAAVLGGKHLAEHIDEKVVAICGGLLFLAFGAHSLWQGPPQ